MCCFLSRRSFVWVEPSETQTSGGQKWARGDWMQTPSGATAEHLLEQRNRAPAQLQQVRAHAEVTSRIPDLSRTVQNQSVFHDCRIFIWPDGSLELLNITKSDEGKYTCFAENDRGRANSTGSLSVTGTTRKQNPNISSSWLLLLLLCSLEKDNVLFTLATT